MLMPETTRSGSAPNHLRDRDVHAVGRRAVHGEDIVGDLLEPERPPQRQRVADGARFEHRRHDRHRAERPERVRQRLMPSDR